MILYTYFRSSASYRVRIALNLKGIAAEYRFVHLVRDGGEQHKPEYRRLNPQGRVPALVVDGRTLTQSLAIIEYLEETHPEPALLPGDPLGRARVRALAHTVASDIQPLGNLAVLQYLERELGIDQARREAWARHWIAQGFTALETLLAGDERTGRFCHGDAPTLADVCLVPQMFNARRMGLDLTPYPTLVRIDAECRKLEAFARAAPENQPDAS
ncbi:MAG TPA: maleylacetoacetate isomerase [Gammaproteobacteria bacterium]|nr:maleylacetoacetate isomerase [Gammaproteobacteria bacterium]